MQLPEDQPNDDYAPVARSSSLAIHYPAQYAMSHNLIPTSMHLTCFTENPSILRREWPTSQPSQTNQQKLKKLQVLVYANKKYKEKSHVILQIIHTIYIYNLQYII